jgi:DNA (cytosine-5)-methyltransferase 1
MDNEKKGKKRETKTIRYIELFGGIGGFRYGIEQALGETAECVFTNEWDERCCQVYNKNFGDKIIPKDIKELDPKDILDFDLLCGGVPCQSWSMAGERKGFEDVRGTMWFEVFKIVKEKRPSFLFLENVKGLLSHNEGKSFEELCEMICELGYVIDFTVLNSKNFGVAQNRERVFILAIREDLLDKSKVI